MITATALKSHRFLAAIKDATRRAVRASHRGVTPAAAIWVENRRGQSNMYVQASRGHAVAYYDNAGRNITDMVLGALRMWHGSLRALRAAKRVSGEPLRWSLYPEASIPVGQFSESIARVLREARPLGVTASPIREYESC